ncbi:retropepsin-like aspartic protease [Haloarcula salinisoli]|uniref:Retropepsin-like domain-containing protein n=1 Tax=Haloarcula salinisoli TaxID=2487746 RepID=A0A8J7YP00_9EURY|nr:retropepsin-like aspartic protease [Halomicroarcula salinisoli]MBX0305286.1 retropepsin-like domain-containing protein [Halomicroarcula salinisoli]
MCQGYFTTTDGQRRPRLSSTAFLATDVNNDLSFKSGSNVDFLVDTGADTTCFTRATAEKLGLSIGSREPTADVSGVGPDTVPLYIIEEPFVLVFDERDEETPNDFHYEYFNEMHVLPSLDGDILGRDFLSRFEIDWSDYHDRINMARIDDAEGDYDVIG